MTEPRKIVLILGNGFDLNLGMETSYKNFWESDYCPKDYPAPLINHLNQKWKDDLDSVKWYDLENELLNYYDSIPDPNKGIDHITEDEKKLIDKFSPYGYKCGHFDMQREILNSLINKQILTYAPPPLDIMQESPFKADCLQSPIWRDYKALSLIKKGLCDYLNSLRLYRANATIAFQVLSCLDQEAEIGHSVNIYTFNYTPVRLNDKELEHAKVHYMHGNSKNGKIILGTRDSLDFAKTYDFLQKSFDPNYNPPSLVAELQDADEIIIFGHSLGINDQQYFKAFFMQQINYISPKHKNITIFTRDDISQLQIKRALQGLTDGNLSTLFGLNHVTFIKTENIKEDLQLLNSFLLNHGMNIFSLNLFINNLLSAKQTYKQQ